MIRRELKTRSIGPLGFLLFLGLCIFRVNARTDFFLQAAFLLGEVHAAGKNEKAQFYCALPGGIEPVRRTVLYVAGNQSDLLRSKVRVAGAGA